MADHETNWKNGKGYNEDIRGPAALAVLVAALAIFLPLPLETRTHGLLAGALAVSTFACAMRWSQYQREKAKKAQQKAQGLIVSEAPPPIWDKNVMDGRFKEPTEQQPWV